MSGRVLLNPFSTNVPLTCKPGSCFLLAKCLKNTCGRVTFSVKMQVIFYMGGTLVENLTLVKLEKKSAFSGIFDI